MLLRIYIIFIEYFIIKKHNRSCQDFFLRKHCKWKRRSWKLVVCDRCLHSKCCKSRQPTMSTTLVIPGPARSNLVLVVVLGVESKGLFLLGTYVPRHVFQARTASQNSTKHRADDLCVNSVWRMFLLDAQCPHFLSADHFFFWLFPLY